MHHFFGKAIFDSMVLIGTNKKKLQKKTALEFDEEDIKATKQIFEIAYQNAIKKSMPSPPVVYIGFYADQYTSEKIFSDVSSAKVANETGMQLNIQKGACAKCGVSIQFADVRDSTEAISVTNSEGEKLSYDQSKCHPEFQNKFSKTSKFFGGMAYTVTLGITYFLDIQGWPGFTNSDEICVYCKQAPGSAGCCTVKQETTFCVHCNKLRGSANCCQNPQYHTVTADHTNKT